MAKRRVSLLWAMVVMLLCGATLPSQGAEKGIVLALSGGGTKGFAHIGVLQVLEREGIPLRGIVGTSMGSIIGGLAACGYSGGELEHIVAEEIDLPALLTDKSTRMQEPLTGESDEVLFRRTFDSELGREGPLGAIPGVRILNRFADLASKATVTSFDELPVPFAAVATDLTTGEMAILREGSLATAMRASMSIPGLFEPWPVRGRLMVDGGLVANVPVRAAQQIFPGARIIAVNVSGGMRAQGKLRSAADVIDQSITIMTRRNVEEDLRRADLVIRPAVGEMPLFAAGREREIIRTGRVAAEAKLDAIRALPSGAGVPEAPSARGEKPIVAGLRVEGLSRAAASYLEQIYRGWVGKPFRTRRVLEACRIIQSRSDVTAVDYRLEKAPDPEGAVTVVLVAQRKAPYEFSVDGYTSSLHAYRWLYLRGVRRNLFREGDLLTGEANMGDNWSSRLHYSSPSARFERFSAGLALHNWKMDPVNAPRTAWERYTLELGAHSRREPFEIMWGALAEQTRIDGGTEEYAGPVLRMQWEDSGDPLKGESAVSMHLAGWWPDFDRILLEMGFKAILPLDGKNHIVFAGGGTEGDSDVPPHRAFLGSPGSLISYTNRPIVADRVAWARVGYRRLLHKSVLGPLYGELYYARGYGWDSDWGREASPWEAGVSVSIPGDLVEGEFLLMYSEDDEWTIGFELGGPYRGHRVIP